ncbi:major facilitator superfamily domain-containing protein [Fusarium tricinctum]|uniref:Major facilitator superfamily domain-containing protein n=2 Tax=Fusarium tricinctum species complex TaxID=679429 RepID=A0A8K0W7T2_9HYPO|nr:major facilitator superfamily domain-containing protein [Fusarium tricinctum]
MVSPIPIDPNTKILHQVYERSHDESDKGIEDPGNDTAVDSNFQHGVQNIEAVTLSWSKTSLIIAFVLIWIIYFVQGLVAGISGALIPYVTSDFAMHSLTATTSVMSSIIGGVTNLSIAKTLDVFGRPQGFLFCVTLATIGLIMSAACNNVEAYAASQVFYTVGINGSGYSLSVFIADTTSLRYRGLVQSICGSPTIITAWLAGPISAAFLNGPGWRWAFGMESILVPTVTIPLFGLFMYHYFKAKKQGLIPNRDSKGTFFDAARYYAREFDVVGLLSLSAGVALFLLPFNLFALQAKKFGSPMIICFFVFGILLLIFFGVWEKYFAKVSFIPWRFLRDRTVAGACILSFTLFFSGMCWNMYFSSILQVVNGLSVEHASYVMSVYSVGGFVFAIFIGWFMSVTGNFKAVTLYFAIPLSILGTGLMAHFRQPEQSIGYTVMSQIFLAFGGGAIMITAEIAILAAVNEQQHFAVAIALVSMCSSIGQAVGLTVSSAIWQDVLPRKLAEYLPAEELPNLPMIAMDIVTQLSYPVGSLTRTAIQHAYGDTHKMLFIAGTAAWVLGVVGTVMWRNIDIRNVKQTKGRVF